jgi:beta-galactosidase beta subunit
VRLSAGQAAILYPSDAHAPQAADGTPTLVKKIVVKVALL